MQIVSGIFHSQTRPEFVIIEISILSVDSLLKSFHFGGFSEGFTPLIVQPLLIMTTTKSSKVQLKPRPKYTKKSMVNSSKSSKVTITKPDPITLTKVQSHLADIQLIDRNALWDFQNRVKINNYEVSEVFKDLKYVVNKINELRSN